MTQAPETVGLTMCRMCAMGLKSCDCLPADDDLEAARALSTNPDGEA